MKYAFSFLVVIALVVIAGVGSQIPGWAKSPVPFPIQTTCGQAKSLDFIARNRLEAPDTKAEVVARMLLEVLTFRSLFRNTKAQIHPGPKLTYESSKWLWLFALIKLMHLGGVFLSPTRNMPNNSRAVRYINPWNPDIKPHSYEGYEDEFREFMVEAGLPVEKELPAQKDEA
ncbi:unnamed protein product [Cyprideis torosa]|uniref:Uncharacterized protein n=1 Tax=Cyprideis torosa TaxID=163714 RepID=A0A7R8WTX3_9CRUS|nr:unnamed protein product [Cyprideis torosa]CAG0906277.1 unnamed protein product [Cyprideis torosa]